MSPTPPDPERWQRLQQRFAEALRQPAGQRETWVRATCADDTALGDDLLSMLRADTDGGHATRAVQDAAARWLTRPSGGHASPDDPSAPGQRIGAWRLVRHLAHGGMGVVYLAERADGAFQLQAALKLLHPLATAPRAALRFEAEREMLARLSHPGIARLLDGGQAGDGVPFLVMEYVDGEPIDAWCDRQGCSVPDILRLVIRICEAVEHAHRHLVVHRDLKPANILVDREGQPRLLDFGIAKLLSDDRPEVTRDGEHLLTPAYAAPEQIRGETITTATDLYALGVLLYRLLTGTLPHPDAATGSLPALQRVLDEDPPPPSRAATDPARRRALQGDLDVLVAKAMHRDPARRYASAGALAQDLARHLAHEPLAARPDGWRYRSGRFVQRHRAGVATAVAVAVAAAGLVGYYTWRLAGERDAALQASRTAAETTRFLEGIFAADDPLSANGERPDVPALVRAGVERVDGELADQPVVRARLLQSLGGVLLHQGKFEEAGELLDRAVQLWRQTPGADDAALSLALRDRAEALVESGDTTAAAPLLDEAERREASLSPPDPYRRAELRFVRAKWQGLTGDIPAAITTLDEVRHLFEAAGPRAALEAAQALGERGRWRAQSGDPAGGLADAQASLQRKLATPQGGRPTIGMEYLNVASTQMQLGRPDEALASVDAALAHAQAHGYRDLDRMVEPMLTIQARLLTEAGRLDEAETAMTEALVRSERRNGLQHPNHAYNLMNLARLREAQGRLDEADRALAAAEAIYAEAGDGWRVYRLAARLQHAQVLLAGGRAADAQRVLEAVRATYAADPTLGPSGLTAHADSLMGEALWQLGRHDDARPLLQSGLAGLKATRGDAHPMTQAAAARWARAASAPGG